MRRSIGRKSVNWKSVSWPSTAQKMMTLNPTIPRWIARWIEEFQAVPHSEIAAEEEAEWQA